ncbi:hypothetical protein BGW80DRAFT_1251984 [Lactifluus volemus]|nr:hypothetical protein BGW80DRAFT_1251984 [Lactifluus volemus]
MERSSASTPSSTTFSLIGFDCSCCSTLSPLFIALWWALAWVVTEAPSIVLSFRGMNEDWNLMFEIRIVSSGCIFVDMTDYDQLFLCDTASSHPHVHTASSSSTSRKTESVALRQLFRHSHNNTPAICYYGQDLQVTIQRTVECVVELFLSPSCGLPKHSLAAPQLNARSTVTIVLTPIMIKFRDISCKLELDFGRQWEPRGVLRFGKARHK